MIGQVVSADGRKYNVIIQAAGTGSRMGGFCDHLPKALAQIGHQRAIDHIIQRHLPVAHKFIIGLGWHGDLLEAYIKGRYPGVQIEFSHQEAGLLATNGITSMLCLDHAGVRHPTLITFCDLLVGNTELSGDTVFAADRHTIGHIGTFRHVLPEGSVFPAGLERSFNGGVPVSGDRRGLLGYFDFQDTAKLKAIAYEKGFMIGDTTDDLVAPYFEQRVATVSLPPWVYEFGNSTDLETVQRLWKGQTHVD